MKKRVIHRIITLLLAVSLLPGLTACGRGKEETAVPLAFQAAPSYIAEDIPLPKDTGELFGSCTDGKSIWFLVAAGEEAARLYRTDLAEGTVEALPEYRPPETPEVASTSRYGPDLAPDGTLWVYETWTVFHYDLPEGFDPETDLKGPYFTGQDTFCHLRQLDPVTGREKKLVDLSEAAQALDLAGSFGVTDFLVDGRGTIYLAGPGGVAALDSQGKHLFTLEADIPDTGFLSSSGGRLALLPDGTAAVLTTQANRREVRTIDPAARDWGEAVYPVPGDVGTIVSGREPCLFYYIWDEVLYGVVEGDAIPQRLLPLENTRLESYSGMACFALLDGGRVAMLTRQYAAGGRDYETRLRLVLLSPTDQLPEDGKIRLVYGTIRENRDIENQIKAFNRKNDQYYIEYRDYTEGALYTADSYEEMTAIRNAARLRVAGEIAAGRAPDIMDDSLPLNVYAKAGYLEDLWPWIDGDPEIGREDLMIHVLECAQTDGKLYSIGGSFTIETAVASRAVAGDRTAWTLEEMLAACGGTMPEIYWGTTQYQFRYNAENTLRQLFRQDQGRYVDWETGECRFDSEDFKDLLRLAASAGNAEQGDDRSAPRLWEEGPALCQTTLQEVKDLVAWDVYFGGPETLSDGTYEAELRDAGVLYTFVSPYNGQEVLNYRNAGFATMMESAKDGRIGYSAAPGAAFGMPDRALYASFAGVPTGAAASSSFTLREPVAISAASQAKEGAWAFLRSLLLPGGYLYTDSWGGMETSYSYGFPMNRSDFEALLEPQWCRVKGDGELILDKNGQPIEAPTDEMPILIGNPIVLAAYQMAPTQAQLNRFWNLYNAIEHVDSYNQDLMNIITEQAQPYFAGDKSLAETARLIQNRATLYVNESR